jgi:hypothetical protein
MSIIWVAVVVIGIGYSVLRAGLSGHHGGPPGLHVESRGPINTIPSRFLLASWRTWELLSIGLPS